MSDKDETAERVADHPLDLDDKSLGRLFPSKSSAFRRGHAAGRADTHAEILNALRKLVAVLERRLQEDIADAMERPAPPLH